MGAPEPVHDGHTAVAHLTLAGDGDTYLDEGDLAGTSGNLYIVVNGEEYGSLFFHRVNGEVMITLGRYEQEEEGWVERSTLTKGGALDVSPAEMERLA